MITLPCEGGRLGYQPCFSKKTSLVPSFIALFKSIAFSNPYHSLQLNLWRHTQEHMHAGTTHRFTYSHHAHTDIHTVKYHW